MKNYRIPRYQSLVNTTLFKRIVSLNLSRVGQGTGYGERKKKLKGTEISTGPTTSSQHSKTKLKALILELGLLLVVGIVKTKGTHYCADY